MPFKFEKLEVWQLALSHIELVDQLAAELPRSEEFNLRSQITRAATSVALNVAEGSTGQTDVEQARFIGLAIRSLIETVACVQIIRLRKLGVDEQRLASVYGSAETLAPKLHRFRQAISPQKGWLREEVDAYVVD
jgi:four helix bundle protein